MTLMQFAFILLCVAQIIHFSKHWYLLTSSLWEDFKDGKRRDAVDWTMPQRRR